MTPVSNNWVAGGRVQAVGKDTVATVLREAVVYSICLDQSELARGLLRL